MGNLIVDVIVNIEKHDNLQVCYKGGWILSGYFLDQPTSLGYQTLDEYEMASKFKSRM